MEELVDHGVLERAHGVAVTKQHVLTSAGIPNWVSVLILLHEALDVDGNHVAILDIVSVLEGISEDVSQRVGRVNLVLWLSVVVTLLVIDIQPDFPTNLALVCGLTEGRELLQQELHRLWLELCEHQIKQVFQIIVRQGVARRLCAVDVNQAASITSVRFFCSASLVRHFPSRILILRSNKEVPQ